MMANERVRRFMSASNCRPQYTFDALAEDGLGFGMEMKFGRFEWAY